MEAQQHVPANTPAGMRIGLYWLSSQCLHGVVRQRIDTCSSHVDIRSDLAKQSSASWHLISNKILYKKSLKILLENLQNFYFKLAEKPLSNFGPRFSEELPQANARHRRWPFADRYTTS